MIGAALEAVAVLDGPTLYALTLLRLSFQDTALQSRNLCQSDLNLSGLAVLQAASSYVVQTGMLDPQVSDSQAASPHLFDLPCLAGPGGRQAGPEACSFHHTAPQPKTSAPHQNYPVRPRLTSATAGARWILFKQRLELASVFRHPCGSQARSWLTSERPTPCYHRLDGTGEPMNGAEALVLATLIAHRIWQGSVAFAPAIGHHHFSGGQIKVARSIAIQDQGQNQIPGHRLSCHQGEPD